MTRMTIALALTSLLVAGSAMAQTAPPPTQTPPAKPPATTTQTPAPAPKPAVPAEPFPPGAMVAYIDLQRVVADSKLGKQGHDAMQTLNDKLSGDLAAKNKEIVALQDRIKQQQNIV